MKAKDTDGNCNIFLDRVFICAINGSSRVNGKTARKLKTILRDVQDLGAKTKLINLAEHPLKHCDGSQEFKMRPDIQRILRYMERADGVIFGTPTYWFNMSGLMKNFMDRLMVTEKGWTLEYKVAGFVAIGEKDEDGAMMAITSMAGVLNHLGMVIFPYSMLYFRGDGPEWAKKDLHDFSKRMLEMVKLTAPLRRKLGGA